MVALRCRRYTYSMGGVCQFLCPTHASQKIHPLRDGSRVGASHMTITETPTENKPPTVGAIQSEKRLAYREWRDAVAQLLQDKHFFDEAERWHYCDDSPRYIINRNKVDIPPTAETVWVCSASSEHDAVLFSSSCDFRICPDCASKHTARLMKRYIPAIEKLLGTHPEYRLRTLTLTRSIQLDDAGFKETAQDGFDLIQKAMLKVVGKNWNKEGAGMLANWEVGANGHKLHYHMIYFGPWVSQKELSKVWKTLTGGDFVVWVKEVNIRDGDWQGAVSEVLKYATKFYKDDKITGERKFLSPELTVKLFVALKRTRRIRSWGSLYNIDEGEERMFVCEDCGAKMVSIGVEYFQVWRETGFTPDGWKAAIRDALLQFRTANKSPPEGGKTDKTDLPQARMLPVLDELPTKGSVHYDHE